MSRLIVYYAHPGLQHSHANAVLFQASEAVSDITRVDLYAEYPRFDIDIDHEQQRLRRHDIIVWQFPLFWYSTPSLLKEWQDLVLEYGFAYGKGGDALRGKALQLALTTGGPEDAYSAEGYQHYPLRTFLTPMEQTAYLCQMRFLPPYVLHDALEAPQDTRLHAHVAGYTRLLRALRDGHYDYQAAANLACTAHDTLPLNSAEP